MASKINIGEYYRHNLSGDIIIITATSPDYISIDSVANKVSFIPYGSVPGSCSQNLAKNILRDYTLLSLPKSKHIRLKKLIKYPLRKFDDTVYKITGQLGFLINCKPTKYLPDDDNELELDLMEWEWEDIFFPEEDEVYNSAMEKLSTRKNKSIFTEEQLKSVEDNENFVVGNKIDMSKEINDGDIITKDGKPYKVILKELIHQKYKIGDVIEKLNMVIVDVKLFNDTWYYTCYMRETGKVVEMYQYTIYQRISAL